MIIRFESYIPSKGKVFDAIVLMTLAAMIALPWLAEG